MNLLIFAQKVDRNDPVFSFFHRWIVGLAGHFAEITVVALFVGEHDLPANVKVLSLGKDEGHSRLTYIWRFYKYVISLRRNYDIVLAHQNQEYPIIGGLLWKILGKRVFMWRNHYAGSWITDLSASFCTKVFCTSKFSYTAKYKKTVFMPVGVDTEVFGPVSEIRRQPNAILSLGRVAPSKNIHQFVEALGLVKASGRNFTATICGAVLPKDQHYLDLLKSRIHDLGLDGSVAIKSGVPNDETPAVYSAHEIFVNLSASGMFDKTIFEAMACETVTISCSKDLVNKIDGVYLFEEGNMADLAHKISAILDMPEGERRARAQKQRTFVEENHSLAHLCARLAEEMK